MIQRIITAVLALALFLPFVIVGGIPFSFAIYILSTISLYELLKMKKIQMVSIPGLVSILLLWILLIPSSHIIVLGNIHISKLEVALLGVLLFLTYTVITKNRFSFDDVGFSLLSVMYIGIGFYYFIETRALGLEFIVFALLVIWATDTGAYFIGKAIGKNKLWPEISPNKTIEGFFGGILCALAVSIVFEMVMPIVHSYVIVALITIFLSVFGQVGDLVESALKRHYHVKDSGQILPGHGGILDRFDSLLFVLPLLHFMLVLF
ncbi:phosphatidate cytidylyltransferase [Metabacillus sp. KIGAM252]|uniref:Phosphatidate cytidylyltransferase n=1 Tax=Metabacillus flavus TaxID=2823519 RepID=A0ABS5LE47_9BACI|nr:phosphatidate cytidylyltransferase [Metabacillus flavus]MBS2969015.1 phosphatidate cytidylyltransferase [Metabacillus flavus]